MNSMLYMNPQSTNGDDSSFFEQIHSVVGSLSDIEKEDFEERAAIMEYDAELSKEEAEWRALRIILENRIKIAV